MRFFAKSTFSDGIGERLFFGDLISTFLGVRETFFRRLRHFSREVVPLFQRGGSSASRTTSLEIWTARQMIIIYAQPIRNAVQHFSREVVPVPAEPPPWKSGQPGTPYEKKTALSGGKTKKKLANFFCGSVIHIKNTFCKKIGSKRPFQPSAVVRAIYTRLYGVATAN